MWIAINVIILIAVITAYYFLRPVPVIPLETQEYIVEACMAESQNFYTYVQAVRSNDPGICEQQTVTKPLCLARVNQDASICETAEQDLQSTCQALAADDATLCDPEDNLCRALLGDKRFCSELGFQRLSCEAALTNDLTYFESERAKADCTELAKFENIVESRKKSGCKRLKHTTLREECLAKLS